MNYIAIGLLVLVGIIVLAAIFIESFQEKIFGGKQGETKIAGFITVKGVSFVVLIIGLSGVATFLELKLADKHQHGVDYAASILKNTENDSFSMDYSPKDSVDIKLNSMVIARIKRNFDFGINKSKTDQNKYDLNIEDATLGNFKLYVEQHTLRYQEGDIYYEDSIYNINNTSFYFKIEDILSTKIGNTTVAKYKVNFAERSKEDKLVWLKRPKEFRKSDNGNLPDEMNLLSSLEWSKN